MATGQGHWSGPLVGAVGQGCWSGPFVGDVGRGCWSGGPARPSYKLLFNINLLLSSKSILPLVIPSPDVKSKLPSNKSINCSDNIEALPLIAKRKKMTVIAILGSRSFLIGSYR